MEGTVEPGDVEVATMARYYVREWDQRYEVDAKGHPLQDGRLKRSGPLEYVRLKVHGRSLGAGWRKLVQIAGVQDAPGVFGIFCKILEVAADAKRDARGYVDDTATEPLFFLLGLDENQVQNALKILSSAQLAWLYKEEERTKEEETNEEIQDNSTQLNAREAGTSGIFREFPANHAEPAYTLDQIKDACVCVGIPEDQAQSYHDHYASQGWRKANSQPITNLRAHMARLWDKAAHCWKIDLGRDGKVPERAGKTAMETWMESHADDET